jgi:uncharacterized protein (TIGR02145 family)
VAYDSAEKFCDERDGKVYKWVRIGEGATAQIWMAENLNYETSTGSWCYTDAAYSNAISNCTTYGRLYDWATVMALDSKCNSTSSSGIECKINTPHIGVCPEDWHLPSDTEWTTLTDFVGDQSAKKLKAADGWGAGSGTDNFDFSALPGGYRSNLSIFYDVGDRSRWWSATGYSASYAYGREMYYSGLSVARSNYDKRSGFSVRCVKN